VSPPRGHPEDPTPIQRMGTNTPITKPKCHGYLCRKNKRKDHRERRNESGNNAARGIYPSRRIPPTKMRRRKTERFMQS